jgi:hypothetical protein
MTVMIHKNKPKFTEINGVHTYSTVKRDNDKQMIRIVPRCKDDPSLPAARTESLTT